VVRKVTAGQIFYSDVASGALLVELGRDAPVAEAWRAPERLFVLTEEEGEDHLEDLAVLSAELAQPLESFGLALLVLALGA